MANTVSTISYANTFGQWMVATDALIAENNTLATGDYTKDSGTLYLSENTKNALQSNGNIVVQKQLLVQGVGSSANIDNNLGVGGQVYFSNTTLGLTNSGQANINGLLVAQASGLSLSVANNTTMGGNNTIRYNLTSNTVQANISVNTGSASITGTTYTNVLNSNTSVIGQVASFSGAAYVDTIQANTGVITPYLQSNNYVNTAALTVSTTTITGTLNSLNKITTGTVQANTSINTASVSVTGGVYADSLTANTQLTTARATISNILDANSAAGFIGTLQTVGQLSVGGNFVINGATVYNSNTFTLNAGSTTGQNSMFSVNRGSSGANAAFRWNEPLKQYEVINVDTSTYYRLLTDEYLTNSLSDTSITKVSTANAANALYTSLTNANNFLQNAVSSAGTAANSAFLKANNAVNFVVGTTGTITPTNGSIRVTSNNGVVAVATAANTLAISTPQDLRTTATPSFSSLTLGTALPVTSGGTGATSSGDSLTNLLPSAVGVTAGYVLATGGPGSYYWAAGGTGSGGGATPGTSISSTRLTYTGNYSVRTFTAPEYIVGANQLRVYIDGVRQFASEYVETSNTVVTLNSPPATGSAVLVEVDGYVLNPYYANNISYTINSTISGSANTIQLAVDALASIVALKSGTTFTGRVFGITPATTNNDTTMATTAFVYNALANTGATYTHNINGNAGSVTDGVYTSSSYANPSWITSIANTKIDGSITNGQIASLATSKLTGTITNAQLDAIASSKISGTMAATQLSNTINYGITVQNAQIVTGLTASNVTTALGATAVQLATTASTANDLNTANSYRVNSFGVGTAPSGTAGEIRATNNITAYYSDDRLKTRKGNIENALAKVMSLNGFYYEANEIAQALGYTVKPEVGVSAQEVQKILPEIVVPAPIDENYLTVHYEKLIPLLIESIKELKAEINELKGSK